MDAAVRIKGPVPVRGESDGLGVGSWFVASGMTWVTGTEVKWKGPRCNGPGTGNEVEE